MKRIQRIRLLVAMAAVGVVAGQGFVLQAGGLPGHWKPQNNPGRNRAVAGSINPGLLSSGAGIKGPPGIAQPPLLGLPRDPILPAALAEPTRLRSDCEQWPSILSRGVTLNLTNVALPPKPPLSNLVVWIDGDDDDEWRTLQAFLERASRL